MIIPGIIIFGIAGGALYYAYNRSSPQKSTNYSTQRSPNPSPQRSPNPSPQRSPNSSPQQSPNSSPPRSPNSSPPRSPNSSPPRSPNSSPQQSTNWYFGNIGRHNAENRLLSPTTNVGTFIVRDGESNPGTYSLSVRDYDTLRGDHVKHYRILELDDDQGYCIDQRSRFESMELLVRYYQSQADGLNLTEAFPKRNPSTGSISNDIWKIDRSSFELEEKIGTGHFGEVWKGMWKGNSPIAVKTFKSDTMTSSEFLAEANIMKTLKHEKLIKLFAVCIDKDDIFIVMELMSRGSLLDLLRNDKGEYLTLRKLVDMGAQVADGMSFLESNSYIHRDLSARNVLVGQHDNCKVADFGLSRLIEDSEYKARRGSKFPIKWTAPEALNYGTFTIKSDVWSYGILLTELVTYGKIPYVGIELELLPDILQRGYRMPKMTIASLYQTMLDCWNKDPQSRPTFSLLYSYMNKYFVATEPNYPDP